MDEVLLVRPPSLGTYLLGRPNCETPFVGSLLSVLSTNDPFLANGSDLPGFLPTNFAHAPFPSSRCDYAECPKFAHNPFGRGAADKGSEFGRLVPAMFPNGCSVEEP